MLISTSYATIKLTLLHQGWSSTSLSMYHYLIYLRLPLSVFILHLALFRVVLSDTPFGTLLASPLIIVTRPCSILCTCPNHFNHTLHVFSFTTKATCRFPLLYTRLFFRKSTSILISCGSLIVKA